MTHTPSSAISAIRDLLLQARTRKTQLTELPESGPQSRADAYAIQDAVCLELQARTGRRVPAWKTGAADAQAEPFVAPILADAVFDSGTRLAADALHEFGAEAELAFELGQDLPPRAEPYSEAEVRAAIAAVRVTIELIDSRLQHWRNASPFWQLADNQMNGALIVGDRITDWQAIDHSQQQAQLLVDGEVRADFTASNTVGDPFNIMIRAVNLTANRLGGLRTGDLFSAGSWTGTCFLAPGCEIEARFPGIGAAQVRIAAAE